MKNKTLEVKAKILNCLGILEIIAIIFILLSIFLKSLLILASGIGIYAAFRLITNILWVCPNCRKKLPKRALEKIPECRACNYKFQ